MAPSPHGGRTAITVLLAHNVRPDPRNLEFVSRYGIDGRVKSCRVVEFKSRRPFGYHIAIFFFGSFCIAYNSARPDQNPMFDVVRLPCKFLGPFRLALL